MLKLRDAVGHCFCLVVTIQIICPSKIPFSIEAAFSLWINNDSKSSESTKCSLQFYFAEKFIGANAVTRKFYSGKDVGIFFSLF